MKKEEFMDIVAEFLKKAPSWIDVYFSLKRMRGVFEMRRGKEKVTAVVPSFNSKIWMIEDFMRYLEKTTKAPYKVTSLVRVQDAEIDSALGNVQYWMQEFNPCFRYSPHVELFFTETLTHGLLGRESHFPLLYYSHQDLGHLGNDYVSLLRNKMQSKEFQEKIRHREENFVRSFTSSVRYVEDLFDRYRRLVVLRIDFSLARGDDSGKEPLEALLEKFKRLKGYAKLRVGVFQHLVGYIAHLEFGVEKGHHIHAIFFFNGDKVRNYYALSKLIVARWEKVTNGEGRHFNSQEKVEQYQCRAIGMIARDDQEKRNCLIYVLFYLSKGDQLLPYKYDEKQRLFFRGEILNKKGS